jgi:hypothetical protein
MLMNRNMEKMVRTRISQILHSLEVVLHSSARRRVKVKITMQLVTLNARHPHSLERVSEEDQPSRDLQRTAVIIIVAKAGTMEAVPAINIKSPFGMLRGDRKMNYYGGQAYNGAR